MNNSLFTVTPIQVEEPTALTVRQSVKLTAMSALISKLDIGETLSDANNRDALMLQAAQLADLFISEDEDHESRKGNST